MADKGKRRIWRRLLLSAGLVVLGGLLLMGIWQRNNLKSLWIAATSDQETIAQKREEQEEKRQDILDRYGISSLDDVEIPYTTNVTAEYVRDKDEIKKLLVAQVSSSVRWQQCVETMIADGVDTFVEIGPGKTLSGFMRKINRSVKVINIQTVEDFEKAVEELQQKM